MKSPCFALAVLAFFAATSVSFGQLSSYSQDFELYDNTLVTALGDDGWLVFGNRFNSSGGYIDGYGPDPAPNNVAAPAFSLITTGQGGLDQGLQGLVAISDYNNAATHADPNIRLESNVFQEQTVGAGETGTWRFQFDAKAGDIDTSQATATAFIKTLDPSNNFALTNFLTIDTTNLPVDWGTYMIDITVDGLDGQLLQFGFLNDAFTNVPTGVFYDNVSFSPTTSANGLSEYKQDFESYDNSLVTALGDDGWLVFGNVSDTLGFLFGYGPDPAPNNSGNPAFSLIATGEGGPDQGAQGLVVFSDYANTSHSFPDRVIESNVFQEQIIGASDSGTWEFRFDAKAGDLVPPSTASAFIKVLDPNNGFALTQFLTLDTGSLPVEWGTYSIDINIDGSTQNGQLLQFGFLNTAGNFDPSGVQYDNVCFQVKPPGLGTYKQDFESYDTTASGALGDDGWVVFGNVFDSGSFLFGYGTFPAPNNQALPSFSVLRTGVGGAAQGSQSLEVLSDYDNTSHDFPTRTIESLVFQEQTIGPDDTGVWRFTFDALFSDIESPSTAEAFVKVLDPESNFSTTASSSIDMSAPPNTWTTFMIDIAIDGSTMSGQILQFGFSNTAGEFDGSGIYYDNVCFEEASATNLFRISEILKSGDSVEVTIPNSSTGVFYDLLKTTTLTGGISSYSIVEQDVEGTGTSLTFFDDFATEDLAYYFVRQNP
ncbi:MAG: hypothetical protein AAGJ79_03390 [Verrucomicrobiota bacterium]